MTPEGSVKEAIKRALRRRGAWWYMPVPYGYGTAVLDFIVCHRGRFYAIEAKAPGKRPTRRQLGVIETLRAHGARVTVIDNAETADTHIAELLEDDASLSRN